MLFSPTFNFSWVTRRMMLLKFSLATTSPPSRVSIRKILHQRKRRKRCKICNFIEIMTWNPREKFKRYVIMIILSNMHVCQVNELSNLIKFLFLWKLLTRMDSDGWLKSFVCTRKTRLEPKYLSTSWILNLLLVCLLTTVMVGYHPKWILYCHHSSWDLHLNSFKCSSV